jgi:hypothetical protein
VRVCVCVCSQRALRDRSRGEVSQEAFQSVKAEREELEEKNVGVMGCSVQHECGLRVCIGRNDDVVLLLLLVAVVVAVVVTSCRNVQRQLREQLMSSSTQLQLLHEALRDADVARTKVCAVPRCPFTCSHCHRARWLWLRSSTRCRWLFRRHAGGE